MTTILSAMSERMDERINLPIGEEMLRAVKMRAELEHISAVALIRKFIQQGLQEHSRLEAIERRLQLVESELHAAEPSEPYGHRHIKPVPPRQGKPKGG